MDLINVASVKEMKMQFRVKFELVLEWFEPRLRWRDLQNNSNLNIIPINSLAEVRILALEWLFLIYSKFAFNSSGKF